MSNSIRRTLRSSFFVGFAASSAFALFCLSHHATGRIYYTLSLKYLPTLAGLLSIIIEPPNRRSNLALFASNLSAEIIFKRCVDRGWIKSIPNGECYLFSASFAAFVYLCAKKNKFDNDTLGQLCKWFLRDPITYIGMSKQGGSQNSSDARKSNIELFSIEDTVKSTMKMATFGYTLNTAVKIIMNPKCLLSLSTLMPILKSERSLKFTTFVGGLCALYKISGYTLMKLQKRNYMTPNDYMISAFIAGLSSHWFKSPSIALYLFWRSIQAVGNKFAETYDLSENTINYCNSMLFALSCGHIFGTLPTEQRFVRKSYLKFLDRVTDGKVLTFNNMIFNLLGFNSEIDDVHLPKLDPKHVSRQFMESVLVWTIR